MPNAPVAEGEPSHRRRDGETTGGFPNRGSGDVGDFVGDPYMARQERELT